MNTTRTAVVFASYIPDGDGLQLGRKYLEAMKKGFSDCDIYIGINPSPMEAEWIETIKCLLPKAKWQVTPGALTLDSDASAYQTALHVLKGEKNKYDLVWFGHTKGVVSKRYNIAERYINEFFGKREEIEKIFDFPKYGCYGLEAAIRPYPLEDYISEYFDRKISQLDIMYLYSFYVLRGDIIDKFLENCQDSFFSKKINDRYYFERDFYQYSFNLGYLPYVKEIVQLNFGVWRKVPSTRAIFNDKAKGWTAYHHNPGVFESIWAEGKRYKIQQKESEIRELIDFIVKNDIQSILDIGCYDGGTTICFANLCRKIVSCDLKIRFDPEPLKNLCNYQAIEGDSHKRGTYKKIKKALGGCKVDLLFIDGDHTFKGSWGDYRRYREFVKDGGWIVFHDIVDSADHRRLGCYVSKTWDKVKTLHRHSIEIIHGPVNWGGIGLVQAETTQGKGLISRLWRRYIQ
ncbi:class I SAM-dependent methyltransferase [Patescibacteria group bacterium]|nr:class I SAM-dependent methyltransferase [Patescibacteria group bacterium]MBU1449224.1 class I SAM-dependent methyltransferase [Patescibacteria group bacterium]MBU2594195.1 class I SAM-dependent methyltransferase [Candidatus Edwardsbacteria bacterium]